MNTTYITTPIYYVNDVPHIGHAYTTVIADTVARFARLKGDDTYFMTGTDEHGQKIEQAAAKKGYTPQAYADEISAKFRELWDKFEISYDHFIRTTDAPKGKLRALFEVLPFAFIYERAGGATSDGYSATLFDMKVEKIHQTTPCFFGSKDEINLLHKFCGSAK